MSDDQLDINLLETGERLRTLSRRVALDPYHKRRVREELMRRHLEMSAGTSQRAAGMLRSRLTGIRRLTLVAPPALAVVLAIALFLSGVPFTRGDHPQTALAARLTHALTQTVPQVTTWQWTLRRWTASDGTSIQRLGSPHVLQRLYVADHRATLYVYIRSNNRWYRAPTSFDRQTVPSFSSSAFWEWQVGALAQRLADGRFTWVRERTLGGKSTQGIRYVVPSGESRKAIATAWVDRADGLLVRLSIVVKHGGQTVERDTADYHYGKQR